MVNLSFRLQTACILYGCLIVSTHFACHPHDAVLALVKRCGIPEREGNPKPERIRGTPVPIEGSFLSRPETYPINHQEEPRERSSWSRFPPTRKAQQRNWTIV